MNLNENAYTAGERQFVLYEYLRRNVFGLHSSGYILEQHFHLKKCENPNFSQGKCSGEKEKTPKPFGFEVFGTLQGIRTPDLLVRSQTLYPAELTTHIAPESLVILAQLKTKCNTFFEKT